LDEAFHVPGRLLTIRLRQTIETKS
jgi:hypothetical protein